ncbi:MAG TPA: T9SS type A sorting domain-containing protein [Bacteroidia bacterium]|nr:T9SS type A sorting domain-containing protein [Bacteroidia bacterium]
MKNYFTITQARRVWTTATAALLFSAGAFAQNERTSNVATESQRIYNPISIVQPNPSPCGRVNMLLAMRITDVEATLSWNTAATADSFRVVCTQLSNGQVYTSTVSGVNHYTVITGLTPLEQYKWYVVAICQGTQSVSGSTKFSTLSTSRIQGTPAHASGLTPVCPGLGLITIPDVDYDRAIIDWTTRAVFDSIQVRFNMSGSPAVKTITIIGTPSYPRYNLAGLAELTSYDVSLSTFCNGGVQSAWSTPMSFTTLRAPGPRFQDPNSTFATRLSPNPASTETKVVIESSIETAVQVSIFDITGKERQTMQSEVPSGVSEIKIDLESLPKGVYLIKVKGPSRTTVQRLIIN